MCENVSHTSTNKTADIPPLDGLRYMVQGIKALEFEEIDEIFIQIADVCSFVADNLNFFP